MQRERISHCLRYGFVFGAEGDDDPRSQVHRQVDSIFCLGKDMNIRAMQAQLDRCCGPAPRPRVQAKPLTGIERERLAELEAIGNEWKEVQEAGR